MCTAVSSSVRFQLLSQYISMVSNFFLLTIKNLPAFFSSRKDSLSIKMPTVICFFFFSLNNGLWRVTQILISTKFQSRYVGKVQRCFQNSSLWLVSWRPWEALESQVFYQSLLFPYYCIWLFNVRIPKQGVPQLYSYVRRKDSTSFYKTSLLSALLG